MGKLLDTFIVVGSKAWNRYVFDEVICHLPGKWVFINSKEELNLTKINQIKPKYIFFLHWSWTVPDEIVNHFECVCFHMTDVPYGRGGSPLQNLIARGHKRTKLTALRMTSEVDAGPIYLKEDLSLEGNAEEIYIRAASLSAQMIERIIREDLQPDPQMGEVVEFKRRKPDESEVLELPTLESLYDFIRMLDAEGYPRAFLKHKGFRYEFSRVGLYHDRIMADVKITRIKENKE